MQIAAPQVQRVESHTRPLLWPHLIMALYGVGWAITFEFGVRIYASEIITLIGFGFVGWKQALGRYPLARKILTAYGLWIFAIGLSDLVNETALFDFARAIATPILGGISFVFVLAVISRNEISFLTFLAASVLAKAILGEPLYSGKFEDFGFDIATSLQSSNYFKIRFEPFLTPAIVLMSCIFLRMGRYNLSYMSFILGMVIYFVVDARSVGFTFLFSGMALIAVRYGLRMNPAAIALSLLSAIFISYGVYAAYTYYTLSAGVGHNATQLMRMSNPYNPFELILQGRSEWGIVSDVVRERPFFGYGSWARDLGNRYTAIMLDQIGVQQQRIQDADDWNFIPVHSLIISSWVWSGILGIISALYIVKNIIKIIRNFLSVRSQLLPAVIFFTIMALWHAFFSPPQAVRFFFPHALALGVLLTAPILSTLASMPGSGRTRAPSRNIIWGQS